MLTAEEVKKIVGVKIAIGEEAVKATKAKLKEKNDFIEDALESFKIFYQHQLCLFQRRINSLSLSLSHIKFENDDLEKLNTDVFPKTNELIENFINS